MAEAAAAVGVAAAAVQFFEFSLKTLTLCKQIHDSEKGATEANQELETSIAKLKQITEDLQLNVVFQRSIVRLRLHGKTVSLQLATSKSS